MINELLDSEYNNVGELFGLDELNHLCQGMSSKQKIKIATRLAGQVKNSRRSRAEMEKFFKQLPIHVKQQLVKGSLRLADSTIYSMKQIKSKTIKMFEPQDDKEVGVRNISNAKLPKNSTFLVSGIILLVGISPEPSNPEMNKAINFHTISTAPAIANGEFSLKANKRQIIPENQSNRRFVTNNDHTVPLGYYKLDNPRLIRDEEVIELVIELGTQHGIQEGTFLWVGLDGTGTTP